MIGSSRESLAALRTSLDDRRRDAGFASVPGDLLAVAGVLAQEKSLRQALADAGQPVAVRAGIAASLFGGRIAEVSQAVLGDAVSARWSSDEDLVDAVERLAAQASFSLAEDDGSLDRIEDELFAFGRAVDSSPDLQLALTNPAATAESKAALVRDLVGATAAPATTELLGYTAGHLRGRRPAAAVEELARLASDQRRQVLAEVRSAVDLSADQRTRLAAALSTLQGRQVRLNVIVDPEVVGGIVVRVGDDVIDGSVASRLEQARRALSA
jgi:F-type H+-transporting ATPase subunit delta